MDKRSMFEKAWSRTGDVHLLAWLFPNIWTAALSGAGTMISAAVGWYQVPLWALPLVAVGVGISIALVLLIVRKAIEPTAPMEAIERPIAVSDWASYVGGNFLGNQTIVHGDFNSKESTDLESNLGNLPAKKLKETALEFAAELRKFEANYHHQSDMRREAQWQRRVLVAKDDRNIQKPETKEAVQKLWLEDGEAETVARAEYQRQFRTRFFARALAIKNALSDIQSIPRDQEYDSPYHSIVLVQGMIVGVNPISEVATVIENLAHNL